jgi:hypothetical protein
MKNEAKIPSVRRTEELGRGENIRDWRDDVDTRSRGELQLSELSDDPHHQWSERWV